MKILNLFHKDLKGVQAVEVRVGLEEAGLKTRC